MANSSYTYSSSGQSATSSGRTSTPTPPSASTPPSYPPPPTSQIRPTTASPSSAARQYASIFGPPTPIDPAQVAATIKNMIGTAPTITAPVVNPAQINLPGGTYEALQKSLYDAQFGPVSQEINRQETAADKALSGQLAQAGLGDSGSGIGQRETQRENYDTYLQNVSQNIAASATSQALGAEIGVASANAQLQQQASLANAGFNLTAQMENAKNILTGGEAAASAYLSVLGINAQQAAQYRSSFNQFYGLEEQAAEAKDKFALDAQGQMFNFYLQQRSLDTQDWQLQQASNQQAFTNAMDKRKLDFQIEQANKSMMAGLGKVNPGGFGGSTLPSTRSGGGSPSSSPRGEVGGVGNTNSGGPPPPPYKSPLGPYDNTIDPNTGLPIGGSALDATGYGVGINGSIDTGANAYGPMNGYDSFGLGFGAANAYAMPPGAGFNGPMPGEPNIGLG